MTILYFGDFNPDYARNKIIMRGLEQHGAHIVHSVRDPHDLVIVGYSDSRWAVPLARLLSSKPIIWDAFYSLYDSWIFDRKLASSKSIKARWYWFLDWLSCRLADRILLDTNAHIDYFVKTFRMDRSKFIRVLIGADDQIFHP